MAIVTLTYKNMDSNLKQLLGTNTLEIDIPHSLSISIGKGVIDMPIPSEGGDTSADIQSSGSMVMTMGGTSRKITISFTITGTDHTDFITKFNRIYAFLSAITIGDTLTLTISDMIVDDPNDKLNYGMWRDVECVFKDATLRRSEGTPDAASVTINLLIGQVL